MPLQLRVPFPTVLCQFVGILFRTVFHLVRILSASDLLDITPKFRNVAMFASVDLHTVFHKISRNDCDVCLHRVSLIPSSLPSH
jgi:hypothetical protein